MVKDPFDNCRSHLLILFLLPENICSGSSHKAEHYPAPTPEFLHPHGGAERPMAALTTNCLYSILTAS